MEQLAEIRERRALTLRDLAKISGVDANTINQIELDHRKPRASTVRKLARALEVNVEDLYGAEREAAPKEPEPFSLAWARAATESEFYTLIKEAPEEDIDHLDKLSGELMRFVTRGLRRELARRNGQPLQEFGPEPEPGEYPAMKARSEAVRAEVKRRRPPFATVKEWAPWIGRTAEVRWLIPPEEWDKHRARVEEMLGGEPYIDVDAREVVTFQEESPQRVTELYDDAA